MSERDFSLCLQGVLFGHGNAQVEPVPICGVLESGMSEVWKSLCLQADQGDSS